MNFPLYLAMTAAEIQNSTALPQHLCYMSCHFSAYSTGLSNLPGSLPPGSMLMLNDRMSIWGHDKEQICCQLCQVVETLNCGSVLLDFQKPCHPQADEIVSALAKALPCRVGVSELYAQAAECAVFLFPSIHKPLSQVLAPWQGREIWLEISPQAQCFTLTSGGCVCREADVPQSSTCVHIDEVLHCRYQTEVTDDAAHFTLWRQPEDWDALFRMEKHLGITWGVGLYQQLANWDKEKPQQDI